MKKSYPVKFAELMFAFAVIAFGISLTFQAGLGVSPWDVFHDGISRLTGISMGTVNLLVSVAVIVVDIFMHEKIGFGSILNSLTIGPMLDFFLRLQLFPSYENMLYRILLFTAGQFLFAFGCFLYMVPGMGAGARDSFSLIYARKFKCSFGAVKAVLDTVVVLLGILLGGSFGVGTILSAFATGPLINLYFRLFRIDAKQIRHEDVLDTVKIIRDSHSLSRPTAC